MNSDHPLLKKELDQIAALDLPFEQLRGKTAAVTGANGLVGRYLVLALKAIDEARSLGMRLLALGRDPERTQAQFEGIGGVECLRYDAGKPLEGIPACDYIVHAASNAHPMAFSTDPVGTMMANFMGTKNLLEHIRENGGRLVFCSSGEVYGEDPQNLTGYDEQTFGRIDPVNPRACYPESKRAAETLCASYVRQYGVDALAARLTYTYGPTITDKNSRADAQFLRKALNGEDIVMKSPGAQVRSYCYVADTVTGLITLMLKGKAGEAYNIADRDCAVSIRTYAETLARLGGVSLTFDLPPETEKAGYSVVTRAVLRSEKLEALGWKAAYTLDSGLEHTLRICADK